MGGTKLTPVIYLDNKKCVNCHACISACPVKYCMDGTGEAILINHDLCIGCGSCIHVCKRGARKVIDDGEAFFKALERKEKIAAIVAPAVASNFPDRYLHLNGYLKSLGVEAVFDVSFGAELTVYSYAQYLKEKNPRLIIAQPCPAIVTFLELFHPRLLGALAPADSPMLHTIKMIREFYPQYRGCRVLAVSPCIAKRREFDETGIGDFNVTFITLKEHFEKNRIDLASYRPLPYDNPPAERAVAFPMPGGLLRTLSRYIPGIWDQTRKIEGVDQIYNYLTELDASLAKGGRQSASLVDCLNCDRGCNGGPGTSQFHAPMNEIEYAIHERVEQAERQYAQRSPKKTFQKLNLLIKGYWKAGLYNRAYQDRSGGYTIKEPTEAEYWEIYKTIGKFTVDDIYDCNACGYGSCRKMAKAIYNKLNVPKNCLHYNLILLNKQDTLAMLNQEMKLRVDRSLAVIDSMNRLIEMVSAKMSRQSESVDHSSQAIESMIASIHSTSEVSQKKRDTVRELVEIAGKGQNSMRETIQSVEEIAKSVDGIAATIKLIGGIAANTNLLSMNAAIEAAHAGDAGAGFSVVAGEIRRLSEDTRTNSRNIAATLSSIIAGIRISSSRSSQTDNLIGAISREIRGFADTMEDLINTFASLASGSSEITAALENLKSLSADMQAGYKEMLDMIHSLRQVMEELSRLALQITAD
ncbi:MAG: methyl-accepting chemotaxis protein [Treponema sp.]|jgi:iron only hydrogenase large subunit-like protein|nr:methyl-accepting chemotaxis protein [Treponema sp.]